MKWFVITLDEGASISSLRHHLNVLDNKKTWYFN